MAHALSSYNIGIIGGGHLGRALAKTFLKSDIARIKLKISYSGNPLTLQKLEQDGLAEYISTNTAIAAACDIAFIVIRPADIKTLKGIGFRGHKTVISCIAGCEIASLEKILLHKVIRIMPSSPITIDEAKAVCALFPNNTRVVQLLTSAGFTLYPLANENLFHIFTASVCLPAAFLQMQVDGNHFSAAEVIDNFSVHFNEFEKMFRWAHALTPFHLSLQEREFYIERMATKGGITEAIINSLKNGSGLSASLQDGINRSMQISLASAGAFNF